MLSVIVDFTSDIALLCRACVSQSIDCYVCRCAAYCILLPRRRLFADDANAVRIGRLFAEPFDVSSLLSTSSAARFWPKSKLDIYYLYHIISYHIYITFTTTIIIYHNHHHQPWLYNPW